MKERKTVVVEEKERPGEEERGLASESSFLSVPLPKIGPRLASFPASLPPIPPLLQALHFD